LAELSSRFFRSSTMASPIPLKAAASSPERCCRGRATFQRFARACRGTRSALRRRGYKGCTSDGRRRRPVSDHDTRPTCSRRRR
jgi:hypothetical protein